MEGKTYKEVPMFSVSTKNPVTFSSEVSGTAEEGGAELEVIKCIINREGYLKRVKGDFKGMGRNLKPELADSLDYLRVSSVDVVEAIVRWRGVKKRTEGEEDAIFFWNGENYLLKMVTDLDFMDGNRTLRKWSGFDFKRNPFCIPAPMEGGNAFMQGVVVDPQHLDGGFMEGFTFAGGSTKGGGGDGGRKKNKLISDKPSPYAAPWTLPPSMAKQLAPIKGSITGDLPAFVPNQDMRRIRESERFLIEEEERCASIEYVVPIGLQSDGTMAMGSTYLAPQLADMTSFGTMVSSPDRKDSHGARLDPIPVAQSLDEALAKPPTALMSATDPTGGQGGMHRALSPKERARSASARAKASRGKAPRKPVKKQTIAQRLAEINVLRAKLKQERLALKDEKDRKFGPKGRDPNRPDTAVSEGEQDEEERRARSLPGPGVGSGSSEESGSESDSSHSAVGSDAGETGDIDEEGTVVAGGRLEASQSLVSLRADPGELAGQSPDVWGPAGDASIDQMETEETQMQQANIALVNGRTRALGGIIAAVKPASAPGTRRNTPFNAEGGMAVAPGEKGSHLPAEAANLPQEQLYELYHWSFNAARIQCVLRGWFARRWVFWHRRMVTTASLVVQRLCRGFLGRRRAWVKKTRFVAARDIQRVQRGRAERAALAKMFRMQFLASRATKIQAQWRRILGRRRVSSKAAMRDKIHECIDTVNERSFFVSDIDELRRRIDTAMRTPVSVQDAGGVSLPPDEVLHLLRVTAALLYESRSPAAGKESFKLLGVSTPPEQLTWYNASQMLGRAETFLRMLRAIATAPHSRPPTVFYISDGVYRLIDAFRDSPRWGLDTFMQMGQGSKACEQIFKWMAGVLDIARRQQEFLAFLTESFPDWLPTLLDRQRESRRVEFEVLAGERCIGRLKEMLRTMDDDPYLQTHVASRLQDIEAAYTKDLYSFKAMKDAELQLCNTELRRETDRVQNAERNLAVPDTELTVVAKEYRTTLQRAERGDELAMTALPALRQRMLALSGEVDLLRLELAYEREQLDRGNRRRARKGEIPGYIRVKALAVGDYRAVYNEANVKASIFVRAQGVNATVDLTKTQQQQMVKIESEEAAKLEMVRNAEDAAYEAFDEFDEETMRLVLENADFREKFQRDLMPSQLEVSNNAARMRAEDAQRSSKRHSYVPSSVLDSVKDRPRPCIIVMTRDLPARSKSRIHGDVTRAMPGQFITVDVADNLGVDQDAMQRVLDAKKCVILMGDYGLTKRSREMFLRSFADAVDKLVPSPFIVMVHGDDWNRRPLEGENGLDQWLGVHHSDLVTSVDGQLKASLQGLAALLGQMSTPGMVAQMQKVEREMREPSAQYLIVMEALFVLQGSDPDGDELEDAMTGSTADQKASQAHTKTIRRPDQQLSGVSWRAVKGLFVDPSLLINKLKAVKRGQSSRRLRASLDEYLSHPNWPAPVGEADKFVVGCASAGGEASPGKAISASQRKDDEVLNMLASYVEAFKVSEHLTHLGGGAPDYGLVKRALKSLQTVLTVRDPDDGLIAAAETATGAAGIQEFGAAAKVQAVKDEAWQVPSSLAIRGALSDLRVLKRVVKIDKELFNVNVYREGEYIYFDAYSSESSQIYKCGITRDEVSSLLLPDAFSVKAGVPLEPPADPVDMYGRLIKLLRFGKASMQPGARRVMVCRRDLTFIEKKTTRISGHRVFMYTYEEALGELFLRCYVPAVGAEVKLHVDDLLKVDIDINAHPILEATLRECDDAKTIWPYIRDRLKLDPPLSGLNAKGDGTDSGFLLSHARHACLAGGMDPLAMGLTLKARTKGGVGRKVTRKLFIYGGVRHVCTLTVHDPSESLRVGVYEPTHSRGTSLILTRLQRRVLLGEFSDDYNEWLPSLIRRLHLDWRGKHTLRLDSCVYRAVQKVTGRRILAEVHLVDHNAPASAGPEFADATFAPVDIPDGAPMLRVKFFDPMLSLTFESTLTKEDMIRVLYYQPPYNTDVDVQTDGLDHKLHGPKEDMLRRLVVESAKLQTRDLDSSTFDVPIIKLLADPFNITAVVTKLCLYAVRVEQKDFRRGYRTVVPVALEFVPFAASSARRPPLMLRLREANTLQSRILGADTQQTPAAGDWTPDEVEAYCWPALRARRQTTPLDMQSELNLMVQRHAQAMLDKRKATHGGALSILAAMGEGIMDTSALTSEDGMSAGMKASVLSDKDKEEIDKEQVVAADEAASAVGDSSQETSLGTGGPLRKYQAPMSERREFVIIRHVNGKEDIEVDWRELRVAMGGGHDDLGSVQSITTVATEDFHGGAVDLDEATRMVVAARAESERLIEMGQDPQPANFSTHLKCVFKEGVKTHFREGSVRWFGHVACSVHEGLSWDPDREVVGRRFIFTCFESHTSGFYTAHIRSTRHLREVLGSGVDHSTMLYPENSFRMLNFIAHQKLEMVLNTTTWDGVPVVKGTEPDYRVEFRSDRLFDFEKVTPVHVGDEADVEAQKNKLINLAKKRGMKIMRMVRKVSGLLLQITVFELPSPDGIRPGAEYEEPHTEATGTAEPTSPLTKNQVTQDGGCWSPTTRDSADVEDGADLQPAAESQSQSPTRRKKRTLIKRGAPMLRLIGYDAQSRSKSSITMVPEAVMELAGGSYSPFLELARRKELAKILCQACLCTFPKGKSFELFINWSGAPQKAAGIAGEKKSWRSSAERVIRRPGKLFRSGVRVSGLALVLTAYTQPKPSSTAYNADEKQIVFNFYAKEVSEAFEFVITDEEQVERVGKRLLDFPQGAARSAAVRRLAKCCRAEVLEDPKQDDKMVLEVTLLPLDHGETPWTEADISKAEATNTLVKITTQSEKAASTVRYFGFGVDGEGTNNNLFHPREIKGQILLRKDITLDLSTETVSEFLLKEFIASAYLRSVDTGVEKGIILRLYMKGTSDTMVMHVGGPTVTSICVSAGEPDLVRDAVTARNDLSNNDPEDVVAGDLGVGLERTDRPHVLKQLHERIVEILLDVVRVRREDNGTTIPYLWNGKNS